MNTALKLIGTIDRFLVFLFMCYFSYIAYSKDFTLGFIAFGLFSLFFAFYIFKFHGNKPVGVLALDLVIIILMLITFIEKEGYEEYKWMAWLILTSAIIDILFIMLLNYNSYKKTGIFKEDN